MDGGPGLPGLGSSPPSQYPGLMGMWGQIVPLLVCAVSPPGIKILSAYLLWDNISMYLFIGSIIYLMNILSKNQQVIGSVGRSYWKLAFDSKKQNKTLTNFFHCVLATLAFFLLLEQRIQICSLFGLLAFCFLSLEWSFVHICASFTPSL